MNYYRKEIFEVDENGSKPKNRFKITCLECGVPMNNDYRTTHNFLFHAEMLKQHKVIRWETLNAPKNPFAARPTKVPHTEKAPSTSTYTSSVPDSIATINDVCRVILLI